MGYYNCSIDYYNYRTSESIKEYSSHNYYCGYSAESMEKYCQINIPHWKKISKNKKVSRKHYDTYAKTNYQYRDRNSFTIVSYTDVSDGIIVNKITNKHILFPEVFKIDCYFGGKDNNYNMVNIDDLELSEFHLLNIFNIEKNWNARDEADYTITLPKRLYPLLFDHILNEKDHQKFSFKKTLSHRSFREYDDFYFISSLEEEISSRIRENNEDSNVLDKTIRIIDKAIHESVLDDFLPDFSLFYFFNEIVNNYLINNKNDLSLIDVFPESYHPHYCTKFFQVKDEYINYYKEMTNNYNNLIINVHNYTDCIADLIFNKKEKSIGYKNNLSTIDLTAYDDYLCFLSASDIVEMFSDNGIKRKIGESNSNKASIHNYKMKYVSFLHSSLSNNENTQESISLAVLEKELSVLNDILTYSHYVEPEKRSDLLTWIDLIMNSFSEKEHTCLLSISQYLNKLIYTFLVISDNIRVNEITAKRIIEDFMSLDVSFITSDYDYDILYDCTQCYIKNDMLVNFSLIKNVIMK